MMPSQHPDKDKDSLTLEQWLTLVHTRGLGIKTLHKLVATLGSKQAVFLSSKSQLNKAGLSDKIIQQLKSQTVANSIEKELQWQQQEGCFILSQNDPLYPTQLLAFEDAPWVLYGKGDPEVLATLQLAIVGSRNSSHTGKQNAWQFAKFLAERGITITSGLALGIDSAAHQGALAAPQGLTIAVAATGLDRVYPASNKQLAEQILQNGCIISEYPLGTQPQPGFFPRRNRIISALSFGSLIVEAALNSGSLITAQYALEQGKEVFAIPGSIHNPLAKGCHKLIKQGAKLVETAEDIFNELSPFLIKPLPASNPCPESKLASVSKNDNNDPEYLQILQYLESDFLSVDTLVNLSGFSAQKVSSILLMLEMQDKVISSPGGHYALNPEAT